MEKVKARKHKILNFFLILVFIMAIFATYLILTRKNLHQIESKGNSPIVYRSAQLSTEYLEKLIKEKNIDVIMNLRGASNDAWYEKEKQLCKKLGVEYYVFGFSVNRPPDRTRFLHLLNILDDAKAHNKKLLIHCKAGADRTGMISTIIQVYLYNFPVDEAFTNSLSIRHGHIPKPEGALEKVIQEYKPYQEQMNFREWILTKYDRDKIINQQ